MTQVSKYKLSDKVYQRIFSLFPEFLYRMIKNGHQKDLIDAFFTNTEKIVFAKRIAIAFMLVNGYKYDQIVNKIKVSHGTVAKISDALKNKGEILSLEFQKIASEEAFVDFLNSVGYNLSKFLPPKGGNWSVWRGNLEKERINKENSF